MTGRGKRGKPKSRFPTLSTALGNPAQAAGFPHSHSYGGGPYSYGKAKQKPYPTYNVPRWAKLNRRNGPKEVAKRNWPHNPASYMAREDGEVTGAMAVNDLWFSDSYGDYIQHFLAGMASAPEWSPPGENHLLSSSSVVVKVSYGPGELRYNTFDQDATELLRLAFHPAHVTANGTPLRPRDDLNEPGWVFNPRTGVLQVRHAKARDIIISGEGSS